MAKPPIILNYPPLRRKEEVLPSQAVPVWSESGDGRLVFATILAKHL